MSCEHPILDQTAGMCYYCGAALAKPRQGTYAVPVGNYTATTADTLTAVFTIDDFEALKLAMDCVVKVYADVPEDQRKESRPKYRKPAEILNPIIERLADIKRKQGK